MMNWYVMQAKPRKEKFLQQQLQSRKIETYLPSIYIMNINPRIPKTRPYFPGYIFVHLDSSMISISILRWVPGAIGIVSFGGEPALVVDSFVNSIRERLEIINLSEENICDLKHGATVIVQNGLFAGYEAIFDIRLSESNRVRILLSLLGNRQIPLELSAANIHPAN